LYVGWLTIHSSSRAQRVDGGSMSQRGMSSINGTALRSARRALRKRVRYRAPRSKSAPNAQK
jgi:hypothetical protein